LTGLRQPTSDIIVPLASSPRMTRFPSLGAVSIVWRMQNHAYPDGLSGHFFFTSLIAYSDPWRASSYAFWSGTEAR
jgi:hypothetical protein